MEQYHLAVSEVLTLTRVLSQTTGYKWDILLSPSLKLSQEEYQNRITWFISADKPGDYYIALLNHNADIAQIDIITINVGSGSVWKSNHTQTDIHTDIQTDIRTHTIELLILHGIIEGYYFGSLFYNRKGHPISMDERGTLIKVKVPQYEIPMTLQFYNWNGQLVYIIKSPFESDIMDCCFNLEGERLGCPSGGISGNGDETMPTFFHEATLFGTITIGPEAYEHHNVIDVNWSFT